MSRPYPASSGTTSYSRTSIAAASLARMRPSGRSSAKKLRRRAARERLCATSSGTDSDRTVLPSSKRSNASREVRKSKLRESAPCRCPTSCPYSSTRRSATGGPRGRPGRPDVVGHVDLRVEVHSGGAQHLEEALGEDTGLAAFHLPDPLLTDAQLVGELALAQATHETALLEHPPQCLSGGDLPAQTSHSAPVVVAMTSVSKSDYMTSNSKSRHLTSKAQSSGPSACAAMAMRTLEDAQPARRTARCARQRLGRVAFVTICLLYT